MDRWRRGDERRRLAAAGGRNGAGRPPAIGGFPVHRISATAPFRQRRGREERTWPTFAARPP